MDDKLKGGKRKISRPKFERNRAIRGGVIAISVLTLWPWTLRYTQLLRRSSSFNVIEVGINRKPVCDFLLVIIVTDILSHTFSESGYRSLLFKFLTLCVLSPLSGLRDNVRSSSWVHLPISVNWTFFARCYSWGAKSEYRLKIGDFAPMRSVWPKISGRRCRPTNHFFLRKLRYMIFRTV